MLWAVQGIGIRPCCHQLSCERRKSAALRTRHSLCFMLLSEAEQVQHPTFTPGLNLQHLLGTSMASSPWVGSQCLRQQSTPSSDGSQPVWRGSGSCLCWQTWLQVVASSGSTRGWGWKGPCAEEEINGSWSFNISG